MSAQDNEKIARATFEAFNARRFDEALKYVADACDYRNVATGEVYRGPQGMRRWMEGWASAFKDSKADIKRVIATDRFVVTEFVGRGTHTGPLDTPAGSVPATNRKVDLACCEIVEIENGKIISGVTYFDAATMMSQLGVTELAGAHR